MELVRRVFSVLLVFDFLLCFFVAPDFICSNDVSLTVSIHKRNAFLNIYSTKAWKKRVFSKFYRKTSKAGYYRSRSLKCNKDFSTGFLLQLAGDVELNPGPTTSPVKKDNGKASSDDRIYGILKELQEGVAGVQKTVNEVNQRLDTFEKELHAVKESVTILNEKQMEIENEVASTKEELNNNFCSIKDLEFAAARQEQYSRKSSLRIFNIKEENGECAEDVCVENLKKYLNIDIVRNEIDIVHRVGRSQGGKPRPILVKFLSHKTKELVMRKRKETKEIRIVEDLAPGIKQMFDFLNSSRSNLNLEFVWTIDGRIKYKFFGDTRPYEIRSYADYHYLVTKSR